MLQQELSIRSTLDGSMQPSLFYAAAEPGRPLLVGLHTWSYDRFNQTGMAQYAERYGMNLLLPEFRGPNLVSNPHREQACASELAMQDIVDAIDYVTANFDVDSGSVLLLGGSGGGHMALMMCGLCPERFRAVAAFVPITDLERWAGENPNYTEHILACCGNSAEELCKRSPISHIDAISRANLKIFHGKFDDSVPFTHSMDLYNRVLLRNPGARVFLEIFDGGHELDMEAGMRWLTSQLDERERVRVSG